MTKQDKMYRLIARQQDSGQTAKAFCKQRQIKLSTFNYWLHKKRQASGQSFVPIDMGTTVADKNQVELVYPNDVRLRLKHFDLKQIHQLINLK